MALTNDFMALQQQKREKEAFHAIDKSGLRQFAEDAYDRFATGIKLDADDHRITRNAYMMQFAKLLEDTEDLYGIRDEGPLIPPAEVEKTLRIHTLRPALILEGYGGDYLENHGQSGGVSQALLAAGMAETALKGNEDAAKIPLLIGDEAADLLKKNAMIYDKSSIYGAPGTNPEVTALHAASMSAEMNRIMRVFDRELETKQSLSLQSANYAISATQHMQELNIGTSDLEDMMMRKYKLVRDTIRDNTVRRASDPIPPEVYDLS